MLGTPLAGVPRRTLRAHALKVTPAPKITARELAKVRQDMNLSRGLFARYLRANVRTLENWEQGRANREFPLLGHNRPVL